MSFSRLLKTMQVFVTCSDLGLPAVPVIVGAESVVSDVLNAAAVEWDVDPEEVELSFAGETLCETERLADHGVGADSELEMWKKRFQLFGKCWFIDDSKREKLLQWLEDHDEEYLNLDTPTFSEYGRLSVDNSLLPSNAERISFRNSNSDITVISQNFLHGSSITSVDLSGLSSITTIGNCFLSSCLRITAVDLSGFSSVTTIGNNFLFICSQITSLDLSCLSSATTIGDYFLFRCSQLTSLDLSCLSSVTTVGDTFLSFCTQLTSLDLSSLSSVTTIGSFFLSSCSQLTSLDLSGLSSVTTIGNRFLCSCSQLTAVDLSGFGSVITIGSFFLSFCSKIASLDLSCLSSVTTIGDNFLCYCSRITSLDLSGLTCTTNIGDEFLTDSIALDSSCTALQSLLLTFRV